jgi:hypothetical protein
MAERRTGVAGAALAAALVALLAAAPAGADEPSGIAGSDSLLDSSVESGLNKGFDLVLIRPLRVVAVVAGAGAFVPAALLTSPGGRPAIESAYQVFVEPAWRSAFIQPLGEL